MCLFHNIARRRTNNPSIQAEHKRILREMVYSIMVYRRALRLQQWEVGLNGVIWVGSCIFHLSLPTQKFQIWLWEDSWFLYRE